MNGCASIPKKETNIKPAPTSDFCFFHIPMNKEAEQGLKKFEYVKANETTRACHCWVHKEEEQKQCWADFDKIKGK